MENKAQGILMTFLVSLHSKKVKSVEQFCSFLLLLFIYFICYQETMEPV